MKVYEEAFEQDLKDEFIHMSFMADLKTKVPRHILHDMFVRAGLGMEWEVVRDCIEREED
jgi:hypothetical protein